MSVLQVKAMKNGVRHNASVDGRNYQVTLRADVESVADGPIAVRDFLASNFGLVAGATWRWPLGGTATETDLGSFLQGVDISHLDNDGLSYRVVLDYKPLDPSVTPGTSLNAWIMTPWDAPPTLKWSSEEVEWAITHDRTGKEILNGAGDPYDPPILDSITVPIATVSRVEKAFDPDWILVYKNRLNDDVWLGWPAESVLCRDISGDRFYDPDWGWLWNVTYVYGFKPEIKADDDTVIQAGWDAYILNSGIRELRDGKLRPIILGNAPTSSPLPLTEDGEYDPDGSPNYLRFKVKLTVDFDDFGMPSNLFSASTP